MAHPIQTSCCTPGIITKVYMIRVYGHHIINGVRENCLTAPAYLTKESAEESIKFCEERYPNLFFKQEIEEVKVV